MIFMKFHENRLIIDGEIYEEHALLVYVLIYLNWAVGLLGIAHFILLGCFIKSVQFYSLSDGNCSSNSHLKVNKNDSDYLCGGRVKHQ